MSSSNRYEESGLASLLGGGVAGWGELGGFISGIVRFLGGRGGLEGAGAAGYFC